MNADRSLEQRLDEIEAVVQTLVVRVAQLGADVDRIRSARAADLQVKAAPPAAPAAPAQPPPMPMPVRPEVAAPAAAPAPRVAPQPPPPPAAPPQPPPPPPPPPRRTVGDLAREWDLVGARGFAIAGGAVMAFGIGLFFVLATNRGWIDDRARVALGATASVLVFGAGLLLRTRYGQYWSALAAVAAGIAGAYATLAAAAARYDLVPDYLALPLAGLIAAVGTVVAVRWKSQVIAAIGLLGAALAPALQALDTDMTWESAAFAVIVLVAVGAVTVTRAWHELLIVASVVVGAQVEWLVADSWRDVAAGTLAVSAAFVLSLLGIAVARQLAARSTQLDPVALSYALASFGAALLVSVQLFETRTDRGIALLVAAAVWAVVFAALQWRRMPDLALVVGTSALALAAVGTADLLSDAALTIAWAAEAIVLAFLARQLGDARLQTLGIAYAALAAVSALATDGRPDLLFDESADQLPGVLPLASAAAAAIACGLLVPAGYRERTESGLLAFLVTVRKGLAAHRAGARETLVFAGAGLGTLAAAFLCLWVSWEWGHVAASLVAATVGAVILAAAGRLRSDPLAAAAYVWLGIVMAEALLFDVRTFGDETSIGGWSVIAAAAGLLLGSYAHRLQSEDEAERDAVFGVAAGLAAAAIALAVAVLTEETTARGLGLTAAAALYLILAGAVFRRAPLRNVSTVLWALGLGFVLGAEWFLVTDSVARAVAFTTTGLVVGALSLPLSEVRLWFAGGATGVVTTAIVVLVLVRPWRDGDELESVLAVALGACVVATIGLAALRFREKRWRDVVTVLWTTGLVALLAAERVVLGGWEETTLAVALTGGAIALLARPLAEVRLWLAGLFVVSIATVATIASFTPPSHFFTASASPAAGIWVLAACIVALVAVSGTAPLDQYRLVLGAVTGGVALYAVSLGILELAERVSTASIETDFERGHTAVSALWALVGLGLLVVGLLRGSAAIRYGGLALFGLSLAKIFLYDLAELSSVARAFSFIFVGGLLLAGGFFLQRLSDRLGPRSP
jgi:uncharacterized membrane protein